MTPSSTPAAPELTPTANASEKAAAVAANHLGERGARPEDVRYLNSAQVSKLMGIEVTTLRNYVWLLRLASSERKERSLQDPPPRMPKPIRSRGILLWEAQTFFHWIDHTYFDYVQTRRILG